MPSQPGAGVASAEGEAVPEPLLTGHSAGSRKEGAQLLQRWRGGSQQMLKKTRGSFFLSNQLQPPQRLPQPLPSPPPVLSRF